MPLLNIKISTKIITVWIVCRFVWMDFAKCFSMLRLFIAALLAHKDTSPGLF